MKRSGVLCLIIMAMSALALHSATGIQDTYATVKAALLGGKPDQAKAAMARISRERSEAISTLITVMNKTDGDNSWEGVRHSAIRLLGEMRADEAVTALSDNMTFRPTGLIVTYETLPREAYYPCTWALSQIGMPAVGRMMGLVGSSRDELTRNLAAWVILKVEGKEQAECRLERKVANSYGDSKPRYEAALEFIQHFKPVFGPPESALQPSEPAN